MNKKTKILFITTNNCWGGSENLWYQTTIYFTKNNVDCYVYIPYYSHSKLGKLKDQIGSEKVITYPRFRPQRFYKRWVNKVIPIYSSQDYLKIVLRQVHPDLVVISNGNFIGNEDIPLIVAKEEFKYVILNHLVSKINWSSLNKDIISNCIDAWGKAIRNYFVSSNNRLLAEEMVGTEISNTEIIYNPTFTLKSAPSYSESTNKYSAAIVGRLECFHKGIDILVHVLKQTKWKDRPIEFNLYGIGPHEEIIKRWIKKHGLKNLKLKGFVEDKSRIWADNQILVLPSRMEGQSISLSEALLFSRTVIGTDVGGISEYITDNKEGFIAKFANPYSLDEAMERAWIRRNEWREIGELAHSKWKSIVPNKPVQYFAESLLSLC